jgi:hypothetical protein
VDDWLHRRPGAGGIKKSAGEFFNGGFSVAKNGLFFAPESFLFLGALLHFELAKNGVPADVDFVPLGFEAAQAALAHLAQGAERRAVGDEAVDFLARG